MIAPVVDACRELARSLADALYPPRCRLCGAAAPDDLACDEHAFAPPAGDPRCDRCAALLPPFLPTGTRCAACRRRRPRFQEVVAAGDYGDGALREWVLAFKHGGRRDLARPLGARLGERLLARTERAESTLLVPVPLHRRRRFERGYDQARLLAHAIAACTGATVAPLLARTRDTTPQGEPGPRSRHANVAGAFERREVPVEVGGRDLWIVDDVLTSGATADACARALGGLGARRTGVLVLARVSPEVGAGEPWEPGEEPRC